MRRSPCWLVLPFLILCSGCGTVNSFANGCPGTYAGVRQDLALLEAYGQPDAVAPEVPLGVDGSLGDLWDRVFVSFDVPLSALADSLALPYTATANPAQAFPTALGCGPARARVARGEASAPSTRETSFRSQGTPLPRRNVGGTPTS